MNQPAKSSPYTDCTSFDLCAWKVLTDACKLLGVQAGTFFEFDSEKQNLKASATYGVLPWRVAKGEFPVSKGICGWVSQHKEAAIVNEVSQDARFNQQIDLMTQFKTVSVLCVPILANGNVLGVLELINREEQPFSPTDLMSLQMLIQVASSRLQELSKS